MKTYGTILIGCGHIGLEHIAEIHYRENVNLVACVDINPDAARMAAHRYGAQTFGTDYRPFLERDDVDIVIIATYTDSHLRILKDCFAKGKHVICEKPIAGSLEDGSEFVRTVKGSKQKCLVAHILRHNDSYIKIKKLIDDGTIGELKLIRMTQNHHAMNWERYKRLLGDCSPIIDCGVHYTDVVQWFSGQKITKVWGMGTKIDDDAPTYNYGIMNFETEGGCRGFYEAGWSQSTASNNTKEFIGTKGRISLTLEEMRSADREEGDLISVYHSDTHVYETINNMSQYKNMYAQFMTLVDMIENDHNGSPTIDEVYSAFRAAVLADRAIRENRIITVD